MKTAYSSIWHSFIYIILDITAESFGQVHKQLIFLLINFIAFFLLPYYLPGIHNEFDIRKHKGRGYFLLNLYTKSP